MEVRRKQSLKQAGGARRGFRMGQKRMDPGTLKPVLPQRSSSQRALGFCPGGWGWIDACLHCFACKFKWRVLLTHTGKQKHAAETSKRTCPMTAVKESCSRYYKWHCIPETWAALWHSSITSVKQRNRDPSINSDTTYIWNTARERLNGKVYIFPLWNSSYSCQGLYTEQNCMR